MMQYASQGLRNTARKGSNTLVHGGHNGPGGTSTNTQARSIHLFSTIRSSGQALHAPPPLPSGSAPRNSANKFFSASRNFVQSFFTHLTAPGLKAPIHLPDTAGSRFLHSSALRSSTIQNRLSTATRYSLRNNALQRQANTFLPRAPGPVPPRFGGVTEVGLGTARNFSTGRPIFQHLAENVPVAVRALYETDLDLELRKRNDRKRLVAPNVVKKVKKTKEMTKPLHKISKYEALTKVESTKPEELLEEVGHYFSAPAVAPVTTYLLIPLAPTPTSRTPLPLDPLPSCPGPLQEPKLLPPISYISSLHRSHAHSLRVSTLFARLEQADVWARGVRCSHYSQGYAHRKRFKPGESDTSDEGVCTILEVEFVGWSKAEVRSIIGESGTGWCVLEEVLHEEDEEFADMESFSSGLSEEEQFSSESLGLGTFGDSGTGIMNPSETFILPTLDLSSDFNSSSPSFRDSSANEVITSIPPEMEDDPWVDDCYNSDSDSDSWGSSHPKLFSELIIEPPSSNGWFGSGLGPGLGFKFEGTRDRDESREIMFI